MTHSLNPKALRTKKYLVFKKHPTDPTGCTTLVESFHGDTKLKEFLLKQPDVKAFIVFRIMEVGVENAITLVHGPRGADRD